jgi:hypothetical protein
LNIKNRSDLAEFPDGGRATLVRRYSPALTAQQFLILTACPYECPGHFDGPEYRIARQLVRWNLLESDPSSPHVFRVTEAGADVVRLWRNAGW